jgi:hypothetical protein
MDIDGPAALTVGAGAAMNAPDLFIDDILRDAARERHHTPLLITLLVAEPEVVLLDPAKQDRCATIRA